MLRILKIDRYFPLNRQKTHCIVLFSSMPYAQGILELPIERNQICLNTKRSSMWEMMSNCVVNSFIQLFNKNWSYFEEMLILSTWMEQFCFCSHLKRLLSLFSLICMLAFIKGSFITFCKQQVGLFFRDTVLYGYFIQSALSWRLKFINPFWRIAACWRPRR